MSAIIDAALNRRRELFVPSEFRVLIYCGNKYDYLHKNGEAAARAFMQKQISRECDPAKLKELKLLPEFKDKKVPEIRKAFVDNYWIKLASDAFTQLWKDMPDS